MRRFIAAILPPLVSVLVVLVFALSVRACPPDVVPDDGGGSFSSFGYGAGVGACEAPMIAGNFGVGAGYAGGASFAMPSYGVQAFAAPVYTRRQFRAGPFAAPAYGYGYGGFAAPVVHRRIVALPAAAYGRGAFARGFRSGAVIAAPGYGYGSAVAAPVVAAPVYGGFGASVVAVPRAPGPFVGAAQGFFGGLRNRLNGF